MRFPEIILDALVTAFVCASSAVAQTYATSTEITAAFVGHEIIITNKNGDSGHVVYGNDHKYTYTDRFGSFDGNYEISDGKICLSGGTRGTHCDTILREGSAFVLVDQDHNTRFSVTFPRP